MLLALEPGWRQRLALEMKQVYFQKLVRFLQTEYLAGAVFPASSNIFRTFNLCPWSKVKVVILGQDPYHGLGQADGLAFSVAKGVPWPPSLANIWQEVVSDYGAELFSAGFELVGNEESLVAGINLSDQLPESRSEVFKLVQHRKMTLQKWARQGVLLLNSTLTVRSGQAASHQGYGWEKFTDVVISILNQQQSGLVFLLWGQAAQAKGGLIDQNKHLVLKTSHPSPLAVYRGFKGSKPFSQANTYLVQSGQRGIAWL